MKAAPAQMQKPISNHWFSRSGFDERRSRSIALLGAIEDIETQIIAVRQARDGLRREIVALDRSCADKFRTGIAWEPD